MLSYKDLCARVKLSHDSRIISFLSHFCHSRYGMGESPHRWTCIPKASHTQQKHLSPKAGCIHVVCKLAPSNSTRERERKFTGLYDDNTGFLNAEQPRTMSPDVADTE